MRELIEFLVLFAVLPTVLCLARLRLPALPLLWALTLYCVWVLARLGKLDAISLAPAGLLQQLSSIFSLFVLFALSTTALVYRYASTELFGFVRARPMLWMLFMLGYPVLSVYPQGIIYRAFLFERYQDLSPKPWLIILMSALAFAYMHIVFRNWIALALTLLGGFIFAIRYAQTGSLFISCFEHSLYGGWLFTVGLGKWFVYDERLARIISAQGSDAPIVFP